jgi:hypothetical protein
MAVILVFLISLQPAVVEVALTCNHQQKRRLVVDQVAVVMEAILATTPEARELRAKETLAAMVLMALIIPVVVVVARELPAEMRLQVQAQPGALALRPVLLGLL